MQPIQNISFKAPKICVSASEYAARHALRLDDFYAILTRALYCLPQPLLFNGRIRLYDLAGMRGETLKTRASLPDIPNTEDEQTFMDVSTFCTMYSLSLEDLLEFGLRRDLPLPYASTSPSGKPVAVIDCDHVDKWLLARQAEAMA